MKNWFIDTPEDLHAFCEQLQGAKQIALDTEFLREKTYFAQLCLLQVASEDMLACIDPLAINDLNPILDIIYNPSVIKVMHSARQDLEIFFDLKGSLPQPIFDTQLAATVLGMGDQLGYASLVEKMRGVRLAKSHTRTDWSRRPLDEGQITYALDDVRHLLQIYSQQFEALEQKERLSWLDNDFEQLTDIQTYMPSEWTLWQKVRGANHLKGVQLGVLQNLARWRDSYAREKNRPRRWILRDELMVELSRRMPDSEEALNKVHGWENGLQRYNSQILQLVQEARALKPEQWPKKQTYLKLTVEQDAVVDILMAIVRTRAVELGVTPSILANRKDLELLLLDKDSQILSGWRKEFIGKELCQALCGDIRLRIQNGKLQVDSHSPE